MKLALFALPVLFAAFVISCGSDSDTLTLEEYFVRFEAIDADADTQIEALYADFPADGDDPTNNDNLPFFRELFTGFPPVIANLVDDIKDLNPPSEVEDVHNDLIEVGEGLVVIFEESVDQFSEAETTAEFFALNDQLEPAIDVATSAFDAACLDVVAVGEANGITVNVTCEDDE